MLARRYPRFARFLLVGGGLGALAAVVAAFGLPVRGSYGRVVLLIYLAAIGVAVGSAIGGLVAVLLLGRVDKHVDSSA